MASDADVKRVFLRLLEEDEEFRYAVAAKIGLLEILGKLEEHDRKFNEILKRLDRHEEILLRHEEILLIHGRRLDRIEMELGALSESFYCRAVWEDLSAEIAGRGEKMVFRRRNLRIDDKDIDLFIETDKAIYVVEVKIKPKRKHVDELLSKVKLVEKKYPGKKVVPVLAGALIDSEVESYARSNNVLVYVY